MAKILKIDQEIITVLLDNHMVEDFPSSKFRFPILSGMEIDAIQSLNNENQYMFAPERKKKKPMVNYFFKVVILTLIALMLAFIITREMGEDVLRLFVSIILV